jgi:hypothetical protein
MVDNVKLKKGDASVSALTLKPGEWGRDEHGRVFVRCWHEIHADRTQRVGMIHDGTPNPKYWTISSAGVVTPSIFFNDEKCGWHVWATLEGWAG